jgi:hypothetical protein
VDEVADRGAAVIVMNCFARFTSTLDLRAVAALLSDRLFGGVPFVPTDEFDELPGVRLARPVLGMSASICGGGPEYGLRANTVLPVFPPGQFPKLRFVEIGDYVEQALASLPRVRVIPT